MRIYWIDAFTHEIFRGNPAAICPTEDPVDDEFMQKLAREINISETAFFHQENDGFRLRWFTPKKEIELCGHATLASAYVLWEHMNYPKDHSIRFHTLSGTLTIHWKEKKVSMDFPRHRPKPTFAPSHLIESLDVVPLYIGKTPFDYLVQIESSEKIRNLTPDFERLSRVNCRGVIVTAKDETGNYDFISRFFAPALNINEDPVTGSAHSALTPFWAEQLEQKTLTAYQASSRGGELWLEDSKERVMISGKCAEVMTAELNKTV